LSNKNQPELSQEGSMQIGGSFTTVAPPLLSPMDVNMMEQPNKEQVSTSQLHFTHTPLCVQTHLYSQQQQTRQKMMKYLDSGVTCNKKLFILDGAMTKYPDDLI
jgi:hypothetical protein